MKHTAQFFRFLLLSLLITTSVAGQNRKTALENNESIQSGQMLYSQGGLVKMQFQNNNLVVMKKGTVIWQSKNWHLSLNKSKIDKLAFENGNIKCFFQNKPVWSSGTNFPDSKLIIGEDGIIKIVAADNTILWENFAGTANSAAPPLVSGGDEGPFPDTVMQPTKKIKLYVLFVDWQDAKASNNNFDSLWNSFTGKGALFNSFKQQGRAINLSVEA
jgi:hypothetical protein